MPAHVPAMITTTTPCTADGPVVMAPSSVAVAVALPMASGVPPGVPPPMPPVAAPSPGQVGEDSPRQARGAANVLMSLFGMPPPNADPPPPGYEETPAPPGMLGSMLAPPAPLASNASPEAPFAFGRPSTRPLARPTRINASTIGPLYAPDAPPPPFTPPSDGEAAGGGAGRPPAHPTHHMAGRPPTHAMGVGQMYMVNGKRMRTARCGQCRGCNSGDCGKCINCVDKPKFGGQARRKQACTMRTCSQPRMLESVGGNDDDGAAADTSGADTTAKERKRIRAEAWQRKANREAASSAVHVADVSEAAKLLVQRTMGSMAPDYSPVAPGMMPPECTMPGCVQVGNAGCGGAPSTHEQRTMAPAHVDMAAMSPAIIAPVSSPAIVEPPPVPQEARTVPVQHTPSQELMAMVYAGAHGGGMAGVAPPREKLDEV